MIVDPRRVATIQSSFEGLGIASRRAAIDQLYREHPNLVQSEVSPPAKPKPSAVLKAAWNLVNNTGCVGCKAISKAALRLRTGSYVAQAFFNKYRPEGKDQNDIWWPRGDIRSRLDALAAAIKDAEEVGQ